MPQWLVNDLSLDGQYPTPHALWQDLEIVLRARQEVPVLADALFCSKGLGLRPAVGPKSLLETLHADAPDTGHRYLALRWITKGPFWESARQSAAAEVFYHARDDVTDQGLGEAARRRLAQIDARSLSFPGVAKFANTPLQVTHLREDETVGEVLVPNLWVLAELAQAARPLIPRVSRWEALIDDVIDRYNRLAMSRNYIAQRLHPYPYAPAVAERVVQLLRVLQQIMEARATYGDGSPQVTELLRVYFVGREAQFSDESAANKKAFKDEMTFPDPTQPDKRLFCSWHGKIRTPLPYRIHFQWPLPKKQTLLKIAYIGPKLTRR